MRDLESSHCMIFGFQPVLTGISVIMVLIAARCWGNSDFIPWHNNNSTRIIQLSNSTAL